MQNLLSNPLFIQIIAGVSITLAILSFIFAILAQKATVKMFDSYKKLLEFNTDILLLLNDSVKNNKDLSSYVNDMRAILADFNNVNCDLVMRNKQLIDELHKFKD